MGDDSVTDDGAEKPNQGDNGRDDDDPVHAAGGELTNNDDDPWEQFVESSGSEEGNAELAVGGGKTVNGATNELNSDTVDASTSHRR